MNYFAQTCAMQHLNRRLYPDVIQTWEFGPVTRTVWDDYNGYGKQVITLPKHDVKRTSAFNDPDTLKILKATWDVCKTYSAFALSNATHSIESPWARIWDEGRGKNQEITAFDLMQDKTFITQKILRKLNEEKNDKVFISEEEQAHHYKKEENPTKTPKLVQ